MRLCQQPEVTSCLIYWLSLPHLYCLFQITCGCNENNHLSNWWVLRFCSEPWALEQLQMSLCLQYVSNWIFVDFLTLSLSCICVWKKNKNHKICNNILKCLLSPKQMAKSWLNPSSPDVASMLGSTESDGQAQKLVFFRFGSHFLKAFVLLTIQENC